MLQLRLFNVTLYYNSKREEISLNFKIRKKRVSEINIT